MIHPLITLGAPDSHATCSPLAILLSTYDPALFCLRFIYGASMVHLGSLAIHLVCLLLVMFALRIGNVFAIMVAVRFTCRFTMNHLLFTCVSHMFHLWFTCSAPPLRLWFTMRCIFAPPLGSISATCRSHIGPCRSPLSHLSATSRRPIGYISATSRSHLGHILVTSRSHLGCISVTYQPTHGHLPFTYGFIVHRAFASLSCACASMEFHGRWGGRCEACFSVLFQEYVRSRRGHPRYFQLECSNVANGACRMHVLTLSCIFQPTRHGPSCQAASCFLLEFILSTKPFLLEVILVSGTVLFHRKHAFLRRFV